MKILYDGAIFGNQASGGINRYFAGLVSNLPDEFVPVVTTFNIRQTNWPSHPNLRVYKGLLFPPERLARRLGRYYFRALMPLLKPQLIHPTYYSTLGVKRLNSYGCPSVLTVYDFIHDIFDPWFGQQQLDARIQNQAIADADAILCISHHTRADLLNRFPQFESKVHVTHLASELTFAMTQGKEPVPDAPYFLFVGARPPYKNFDGLARAFARLATLAPDAKLVVVGAPFTPAERALLSELNIENRVESQQNISDTQLARLYRHSLALVYPSHYEGFGIPPLEAMACETLVIAANNSSIPEVVGDAALLFDSRNTDELAGLMEAVWRGEINREELIERGRQCAAQFSWGQTATQTAAIYRALVERN